MNPDRDEDVKRIRAHANQLSEHYDSVQIFCCNKDGDNSMSINVGTGNYVTRYGQVKQWIIRMEEQEGVDARKEVEED